jgi:hypothetical protein
MVKRPQAIAGTNWLPISSRSTTVGPLVEGWVAGMLLQT